MFRNPLMMCFGVAVALVASVANAQKFDNLLSRVPDGANTLILIDVEKLHDSPLGKKEGWRTKHENAFSAGVAGVPPQASVFVKAAKLDYGTLDTDWEVSLMDLNYEPNIAKIAARYQGTTDRISDREVAILPGDMYAVKFGPRIAGVGAPAKRQDVANWINRIYSNSLQGLSPYLDGQKLFAERNAQIIMAMDLSHAVSISQVKEKLGKSPLLKDKNVDIDELSEALASIHGVSLGIGVNESRIGAIKIDFDKDITVIGDLAKPILLKVLADHGVLIYEFTDWQVSVSGKSIQLTGALQQSGMRRILSLLDVPPSLQDAAASVDVNDPASKEKLAGLSSQAYFKSVQSLIDDLNQDKKNRQTMGQMSVWFTKYARQIDRLPILNVDEDLLNYGKFVSESLLQGSSSVTNAAAQSRIRQQEVPEQYDVQTWSRPVGVTWYGGAYSWNGWSATPNRNRKGQIQAGVRTQERIKGSMDANIVMQHIQEASADIRRYMTARYNIEF
ncbi:MAG: hypothetical protein ACI9G1_002302 [Pirellulaceae bacterium]|jgi:hypothetical protein